MDKSLSELASQFYILIDHSPKIDEEIKNKMLLYRKIDVFAYTAETLDAYLPFAFDYPTYCKEHKLIEEKSIRILTRSAIAEKEAEEDWNLKNRLDDKEKANGKKVYWNKSSKVRTFDKKYDVAHKIIIEQRFYDETPLFRGYIFGDDMEYKEAYIGFYEWKEDSTLDTPYVGFGLPLFHITDKTIQGKKMLDIIVSRFRQCWIYSKTKKNAIT